MKGIEVRAAARRRRSRGWKVAVAASVMGLAWGGGALAVQAPAKPGSPDLRDPKVAASVPNISGHWFTRGFNPRTKPDDGTETPWLPWSKDEYDKREKARKDGAPMVDPTDVANAILSAATKHTHNIKVGMMSKVNTFAAKNMPNVAERMAAKQIPNLQKDHAPIHPEGTLHNPGESGHTHGNHPNA